MRSFLRLGGRNRWVGATLALVLLVPYLAPTAIGMVATQTQSKTPDDPVPNEVDLIGFSTEDLVRSERGKLLAGILSSAKYKDLKGRLVEEGLSPRIGEATATRWTSTDQTFDFVQVIVPFESTQNPELRAIILMKIANDEISEALSSTIRKNATEMEVHSISLTSGVPIASDYLASFDGNSVTFTISGPLGTVTETVPNVTFFDASVTNFVVCTPFGCLRTGYRIVFTDAETHTLQQALIVGFAIAGIIAVLCGACAIVAGPVAIILALAVVIIAIVDNQGGHKGIFVRTIFGCCSTIGSNP